MAESDKELMRRFRKGDAGTWERLADRYERLVFSIPLNYGLSREDAADIAQLSFTILIQTLDADTEIERLGPWLATVARRHTWRLMERGRREGTGTYEDLAQSAKLVGGNETDSVERWEMTEWLHDGLSRVGEPCRELLQALYFDEDGSSYAEVAARLGRPVGSIGPTRARCLERLREVMLAR